MKNIKTCNNDIELYNKLKEQLLNKLCELFEEYIQNDYVTELLAIELGFKMGIEW